MLNDTNSSSAFGFHNYSNNNNTSNYNSSTFYYYDVPPEEEELLPYYPASFRYFIYTIYTIIFITAIVGNSLVIYVVISSKRTMRTATNFLIANLALGDLLLALLCVPFGYVSVLWQEWPFGEILCHVVFPSQGIFVFVSAYTLVILAIERYSAIVLTDRKWGRGKALGAIGIVWILSIIVNLPVALVTGVERVEFQDVVVGNNETLVDSEFVMYHEEHENETSATSRVLCKETGWPSPTLNLAYTLTLLILQYFLPLAVLIFTYTRIIIEIWWNKEKSDLVKNLNGSGTGATTSTANLRELRLEKAKRKTISTLLLVVTSYTLAWLPLNLLYLYIELLEWEPFEYFGYVYILSHWLAMSHTTFNPIIYAGMNEKFREGFVCGRRKRDNRNTNKGTPINNKYEYTNNTNRTNINNTANYKRES